MSKRVAELIPQARRETTPGLNEPAYARVEETRGILGNGLLEVQIDFAHRSLQNALIINKLAGDEVPVGFSPFQAWLDHSVVSGHTSEPGELVARGSSNLSSLAMRMSCEWFDVEATLSVQRGDHFLQKRVLFRNVRKEARLHRVAPLSHTYGPEHEIILHDGGMYYPVVFVRGGKGSLFCSVDFPGYEFNVEERGYTLDYYPGADLRPGLSLQSLAVNVGVCARQGRVRANPYHEGGADLDLGEAAWFRHYLLRGKPSPQVPYLEVKGTEPTAEGPSDLEILDQCAWMGAKHVILPRQLQSPDAYPQLATVKQRAAASGISLGFIWSRDRAENVRWVAHRSLDREGAPRSDAFFAFDAYREFLLDYHLTLMERHGFREVEVMGSPIVPYHSPSHSNPKPVADRELLHKAFQGLADVVAALRENFGHVSCSGAYATYGAGLAGLFDAASLLVDEHPLPLPDVHVGRLFGDMTRLYFRRSHDYLLPKVTLGNSVGLAQEACPDAAYPGAEFYPWHQYHDRDGWRYSLLSAIATGLRHRFHPVPADLPEEERAWAREWLEWEAEHVADLRECEEILDEPGLNNVDGYSYTGEHSAIVFLFNSSYDAKEVTLRLGLKRDCEYVARERYPRRMNYLGPEGGLFRRDSTLELRLEAKEARIVEVVRRSPAAARRKRPEVFGAPAHTQGGHISVEGRPGERLRVGVRAGDTYKEHDVHLPGADMQPRMTDWSYVTRPFMEGVETLPHGNFPARPCTEDCPDRMNVWLTGKVTLPRDWEGRLDTSPFHLARPVWAFPDRLIFVIRFEPPSQFDPINPYRYPTGMAEVHQDRMPMKCGIDLAQLNLNPKAWVNGEERTVFPALACWKRLQPNPHPVVAYFFEAGSALRFGYRNQVVLFFRHFHPEHFRGIYMEHMPAMRVEKELPAE